MLLDSPFGYDDFVFRIEFEIELGNRGSADGNLLVCKDPFDGIPRLIGHFFEQKKQELGFLLYRKHLNLPRIDQPFLGSCSFGIVLIHERLLNNNSKVLF